MSFPADNPVVYVLPRKDGVYKIGCTVNLHKRYQAKRTRDVAVAVLECSNHVLLESEIHRFFANQRADPYMEHFRLSPKDLETLKNMGCSKECPACKSRKWGK